MSATITHAGGVIAPTVVDGYESKSEGRSRVHEILGSGTVDVTLRPATPRTGTLRLLFVSETESAAAERILGRGEIFTLNTPERTTIQMRFFIPHGGSITRTLDPDTRDQWHLAADFQEVAP